MKLYEYQGMRLFQEADIPIQPFVVVETAQEAEKAAREFAPHKTVLKAQVLSGGRGKAGGVKIAGSPEAAGKEAESILSLSIGGYRVKKLLITPVAPIDREFYMGVALDQRQKRAVLILSGEGGVDIEEQAIRSPQSIHQLALSPQGEPDREALESLLSQLFPAGLVAEAHRCVEKLIKVFYGKDCSLVEINPFVSTTESGLLALDSKVVLDDNGLLFSPDLEQLRNAEEYSEDELDARRSGLSFVSMDGQIGCIVNGAGLAMATMDLVSLFGGTPANFLDVGGSSNPQKVLDALRIIGKNPQVRAILINIFGGITRCDDVAEGIVMAKKKLGFSVPLVVRLVGTNEEKGRSILQAEGISVETSLSEAVRRAVKEGGVSQ